MEDVLKERIRPHPEDVTPFRTITVQKTKTTDQHESSVPQPLADETAIPIPTPPVLSPYPRIPSPPLPRASPPPEKPASPPLEKPESPPLEKPATPSSEQPVTPPSEQNILQLPESPPPYIINFEKIRRGNIVFL